MTISIASPSSLNSLRLYASLHPAFPETWFSFAPSPLCGSKFLHPFAINSSSLPRHHHSSTRSFHDFPNCLLRHPSSPRGSTPLFIRRFTHPCFPLPLRLFAVPNVFIRRLLAFLTVRHGASMTTPIASSVIPHPPAARRLSSSGVSPTLVFLCLFASLRFQISLPLCGGEL